MKRLTDEQVEAFKRTSRALRERGVEALDNVAIGIDLMLEIEGRTREMEEQRAQQERLAQAAEVVRHNLVTPGADLRASLLSAIKAQNEGREW